MRRWRAAMSSPRPQLHLSYCPCPPFQGKLGAELTLLSKDQADYINVPVSGPYKAQSYRCVDTTSAAMRTNTCPSHTVQQLCRHPPCRY